MAEQLDKKATAIAKSKATLAAKEKVAKLEKMYSTVASEMPSEWVKNDANKIELVKSMHKEILGLDKTGKMRPMGDFVRFMNIANQAGLNPFLNEIYGLYFYDSSIKADKLTVITGINGFRKAAASDSLAAMRYVGSGEPVVEFKNDVQRQKLPYADVFGDTDIPHKVTVEIKGLNPITGEIQTVAVGIAYWDEYVKLVQEKAWENGHSQNTGRQVPNSNWLTKPIVMLKKCAEADGLRKAYPNRLNAVYERAEFDHLENVVDAEEVKEQEQEQVDEINAALEARKKNGDVFEQKAKEIVEGE